MKRYSRREWKYIGCNVQDNDDVAHKDVTLYCDSNQFQTLPFCVSHPKLHVSRGLSKHDHFRFDTKLGHGLCEICRISCACVACTSILDKPWIYGIMSTKQAHYQPVTNFTYWTVLGSYNNWNIIDLTPKSIPFEDFYEIHKMVLNGIGENMAS